MNPDWLLKHFDQISEAPDAVPRLRRFILDLAVRGKLVPQDPSEGSADSVIEEINKTRQRLIAEGKLSPRFGAIAHNGPFVIPSGWRWTSFGQITFCRDGERIPVSREERLLRKGGYDYYGASGVIDKIDGYLFDKPLLLVGEDGANLINRSTPIAFIARGKYWVNNHAHVLDGVSEELLRFLELFINAIDLKPYITGTAQPKMNQAKMNSIPIAIPPLAEQHRIVSKVNELMGLCDELEAAQSKGEKQRDRLVSATLHSLENGKGGSPTHPYKQEDDFSETAPPDCRDAAHFFFNNLARLITRPEHIQQLRQTILNLAVLGKLVPQDPNDELTSELLAELHKARVTMQGGDNIRERKPVERIQRAHLGYVIPESWGLPFFDDVFVIISGVTKGRRLTGVTTIEVPYLRVANVQRGYLDLNIVKAIRILQSELPRYRLRKGDILMTEGGDWDKLGRAAIWLGDLPDCIHQNHIFRVRSPLLDKLLPEWVATYTNSDLGRAYFENASKQTTNLASINMTQLRGCPLPLPTAAEQHRIVKKVDELMALCTQLEARLASTTSSRSRLTDVALNQTLNGR
jgi:type I restriction enzyme S subunit